MIAAIIENAELKLALVIPTCAPITLAKEAVKILSLVADKTINALSN